MERMAEESDKRRLNAKARSVRLSTARNHEPFVRLMMVPLSRTRELTVPPRPTALAARPQAAVGPVNWVQAAPYRPPPPHGQASTVALRSVPQKKRLCRGWVFVRGEQLMEARNPDPRCCSGR